MTGPELKKIVDNQRLGIDEIVKKSGIPKRTLYNLFKKEEVEEYRLEDLRNAIKLPESANKEIVELEKTIKSHTELGINSDEKEELELLRAENRELVKTLSETRKELNDMSLRFIELVQVKSPEKLKVNTVKNVTKNKVASRRDSK